MLLISRSQLMRGLFHTLFFRWRAHELIKSIPPKDLPQIRAKVAAVELLKGQRADIGLQRAWHGDYMASVRVAAFIF